MPTFSKLYSSFLDRELGTDDSTRLFTTARRQSAINEAAQQFNDLTECYVRVSTITCSNGVGEYNLLSSTVVPGNDFTRLVKQRPEFSLTSSGGTITRRSGNDFLERDVTWLDLNRPEWRDSTGGTPECFYLRSDGGRTLFGMYPPPRVLSTAGESAQVLLPYLALAPTMTSDTDVPFTSTSGTRTDLVPFHQGLAHYGASQLEKLRLNDQGSQTQMQLFLSYVQRWIQESRKKGGTWMRSATNYFANARGRRWEDVDRPSWYR